MINSSDKLNPVNHLKKNKDSVLITIPSLSFEKKQQLYSKISLFSHKVKMLPGLYDLLIGGEINKNLDTFTTEDYLGRDKVKISIDDFSKIYSNKTIMITGAGGSIGSELCKNLICIKIF